MTDCKTEHATLLVDVCNLAIFPAPPLSFDLWFELTTKTRVVSGLEMERSWAWHRRDQWDEADLEEARDPKIFLDVRYVKKNDNEEPLAFSFSFAIPSLPQSTSCWLTLLGKDHIKRHHFLAT